MPTNNASAPSASSSNNAMSRPLPPRSRRAVLLAAILGNAVGPAGATGAAATRVTGRGRWVAADWPDLPGWGGDAVIHWWPALLRSCQRAAPEWAAVCAAAARLNEPDEPRVREFLVQQLRPWRVETADGRAEGLITGYFEPLVDARRHRGGSFTVPLHALPDGLQPGVPWYTRAQIETVAAAQAALRGRELAWVRDPLEALLIQIQGSGRVRLLDADPPQTWRLAYAGHNQQPYVSIGRWLVEQKAFTLEQASWPAIRDWARANRARLREMLWANPRYVFFRAEPLPDPSIGPVGAQGVPLTPGRSIAVDKDSIPYGTPVWLDTWEPQPWLPPEQAASAAPPRPLQRLVMAQDTGVAITGAVRADYFWGWSQGAEDRAGRMKQPLRMWALWPREPG